MLKQTKKVFNISTWAALKQQHEDLDGLGLPSSTGGKEMANNTNRTSDKPTLNRVCGSSRSSIKKMMKREEIVASKSVVGAATLKFSCICSPTTHPGSFRCRMHRNNTLRIKSSPRLVMEWIWGWERMCVCFFSFWNKYIFEFFLSQEWGWAYSGVVYTMDHEVIPMPCEICDWLLNLSQDYFGLHQGKNDSVTMEFEVPKIHILRLAISTNMIQWFLWWERQKEVL